MYKAIRRWGREELRAWTVFAAFVALVTTAQAVDSLVPASFWYRLDSVHVLDARQGGPVIVSIQREIRRTFAGGYEAAIWPEDMSAPTCRGSDEISYTPAKGLVVKPLSWWAANQRPPCLPEMTPGTYRLQVCIFIQPEALLLSWMSERAVCAWSNTFTIWEATP